MTNLVITRRGGINSQFYLSFTAGPGMSPTGTKNFSTEEEVRTFLTDTVKLPVDTIERALSDVRGFPSTRTTAIERLPFDEKDVFQMTR